MRLRRSANLFLATSDDRRSMRAPGQKRLPLFDHPPQPRLQIPVLHLFAGKPSQFLALWTGANLRMLGSNENVADVVVKMRRFTSQRGNFMNIEIEGTRGRNDQP